MSTKKAFTLIELLVVIAIIALLLAILIPVLGKAKTIAQEVLCKSNLHQFSIATQLFSQDNDAKFPDAHNSLYNDKARDRENPNGWSRSCRWHNEEMSLESFPEYAGPFWEYVPNTKVNTCPTFAKLGKGGPHSSCSVPSYKVQFTYSMNWHLRDQKITQVRSPSETFIWAEENGWKLTGLADYVLNDNALWIDPPGSVRDNFGSFHKISKGNLSIQRSTNVYKSGVANVLLLDGSTTFISPEEGWKYTGEK